MNVEDSVRVRVNEDRRQQSHIPGEANPVRTRFVKLVDDPIVMGFAVGEIFVGNDGCFEPLLPRPVDAWSIGPVRDDDPDLGWDLSGLARGNDAFHVGAGAGDQDPEFRKRHGGIVMQTRSRSRLGALQRAAPGAIFCIVGGPLTKSLHR